MKYLLNNRKHATYWNSTRDTALVVEAFADYLATSGEMKPDMSVEVLIDGEVRKAVEITPATLFTFGNPLGAGRRGCSPPASTPSSYARRATARCTSTAT